eukprot:XP_015129800.2 uncharacterized protein LOC107050595 [Gallus gallus]
MRVLRAAPLGLLRPPRPPHPPADPQPGPGTPKAFPGGQWAPGAPEGGAMDSALYHLTTLICSVGTCYSLWALAQASRPKKP